VFNLYFLLSWSEWILLFEIEISESVIDLSVVGLVRPDGQDDVPHESSISKFPVVLGDDRGRKAAPHWQFALVDLVNDVGVGNDGLLLQVSHEPVTEPWGDQVTEGEAESEEDLGGDDCRSEERTWMS